MKQRFRLTESDLHKVIKESVREILSESHSCHDLNKAHELLVNITKSQFIPFSSPFPSSTEMKVKKHIFQAIQNLNIAIELCEELGY